MLNPTSDHPNLKEAQKIIKDIEYRRIPKLIAEIESNEENQSLNARKIMAYLKHSSNELSEKLIPRGKKLRKNLKEIEKNINVISKVIHPGKGFDVNPMEDVSFYPRNSRTKTVAAKRKITSQICVNIFAPYDCSPEEARWINKTLKAYCKSHNLPEPIYTFRRDDFY